MNREVFLSILAMDSYQRGDAPGVRGLPNPSPGVSVKIGKATLKAVELPLGSREAGFFAQSYTLDTAWAGLTEGTTVVSYRGTDFDALNGGSISQSQFARDLLHGWTTFLTAGLPSQFSLARNFFTAVTGRSFSDGTPQNNAPVANTIVTGHSLGGALAANDNGAMERAA